MSWRPLVTDAATRGQIAGALREIRAAVLATPAKSSSDLLDRALLFAYLAQDDTIPDDGEVGTALAEGVSHFVSMPGSGALFGGAAGVGWIVEHITGGEEAETVCSAVDTVLGRSLEGAWRGEYDLIGGLVGHGVYALGRGALAIRVLDQLEALATPRAGGLAWHTRADLLPSWQRAIAPDGYWNFGLAHGVPGVIALLARYVEAGIDVERARRLLDGAVAYLLAAEPPRAGRYPSWHPSPGGPNRRLAWCYGDFGVSLALLAAAHACDRDDWRREALALARACAATGFDDAQVFDTGLCHGAAGAAHLFARLHHATGDELFADAARRWVDRTFAMRRAEPIAGFPSRRLDGDVETWQPTASLLEGAVGVGLALHALSSEVEPGWDRMLLVDVPPRR